MPLPIVVDRDIHKEIIFTREGKTKQKLYYKSYFGSWSWDKTPKNGTYKYLGDDGEKIEVCWHDDGLIPYWGW